MVGVFFAVGSDQSDGGSDGEGPEEFGDGDVEADGGFLEYSVADVEGEDGLAPGDEVDDGGVRHHDAFGAAGGAGGEDDVRGVAWCGR